MPRQSRLDNAGSLHPVMVRGIKKSEFLKNLLVETESGSYPQLKVKRPGESISDIIAEYCAQTGIDSKLLCSGSW